MDETKLNKQEWKRAPLTPAAELLVVCTPEVWVELETKRSEEMAARARQAAELDRASNERWYRLRELRESLPRLTVGMLREKLAEYPQNMLISLPCASCGEDDEDRSLVAVACDEIVGMVNLLVRELAPVEEVKG